MSSPWLAERLFATPSKLRPNPTLRYDSPPHPTLPAHPATPSRLRLFAGPTTSSPIRKRRRFEDDESCQSPGVSLRSPDSSFECFRTNPVTGCPSPCRRSPRLLDNGYYLLDDDSFVWDDRGNLTLTPDKTAVSYKENPARIWRRRKRCRARGRGSLSSLLDVCVSWLDHTVFGGRRPAPLPLEPLLLEPLALEEPLPLALEEPLPLAQSSWLDDSATDLDAPCHAPGHAPWSSAPFSSAPFSFTYDHSDVITPPEKVVQEDATQEEICTETCHSQEQLTQSVPGLLDVPPPSSFHHVSSPQTDQPDLVTVRVLFVLFLFIFIVMVMFSRCPLSGLTVAGITTALLKATLFFCGCGPMGRWREAKTEDITSGHE